MNKDVKYNGYSAVPSDYECQDGELAMSLNLLNEDGTIKPLCSPAKILSAATGQQPLLKHHVPGQDNWIILSGDRKQNFSLYWFRELPTTEDTSAASQITFKETLTNLIDIAIVGNTICIATNQGIHYILWKDGNYKHLGSRPPFIPVKLGAYKVGNLNDSTSTSYDTVPRWTWVNYSGAYTSGANKPNVSRKDEDKQFWAGVSNQAYGLLLNSVAENVSSKGCFYQPFFVRYAYRLYDGSYSWHSSPILILPTIKLPKIKITCSTYGDCGMTVTCTLDMPYFGLAYRILGDTESLKDWSDIVTGIDIFISQPLYLFDQSKDLDFPTYEYYLFANHGVTAGVSSGASGHRGRGDTSDATITDGSSESSSTSIFVGHYADTITGNYVDRYLDDFSYYDSRTLVCGLYPSDNFLDRIKNEYLFYHIASIDVDDIASMSAMARLPLKKTDLTEINTLQSLEDDYNSHAKILPTFLHSYNGRLNMSGISICPAQPFNFSAYAEEATKVGTGDTETMIPTTAVEVVRVYSRINGVKCVAEYSLPLVNQQTNYPEWYPFANNCPRFIYHPDASAYRMEVLQNGVVKHSFNLVSHAHLNGAYWFGGLQPTPTFATDNVSDTNLPTTVEVANKIYTSEVNNPFVFLAKNIVTIGCGKILGINSAAKALSQGQFGQFPLYAFTDEGVWALEVSATGAYSARQPITRDVCINRNSITQIDSAVLFATDRGIMLLSGSQSQCISDIINTDYPCDVTLLAGSNKFGHDTQLSPFINFIADCGIVYDYVHQRLIIYNAAADYSYVYSMKSQKWSIMDCDIVAHIPAYPEALAFNDSNKVVDYGIDGNVLSGLLVTRPLKLGLQDIHKTIDTIIQRGNFAKGNVKSVLYGSRDLINWHLVWSSKDHYLRGFRGTPYKYFRIALLCNLAPGESIYGASVQFTPRLTNQPR